MRRTTPSKSGSPTGQINSTPPTQTLAHLSQELSLSPATPGASVAKLAQPSHKHLLLPNSAEGWGASRGSVQRHWFGGYCWATVAAHKARSCDEKTMARLSQELSLSPATPGASVANAGATVAKASTPPKLIGEEWCYQRQRATSLVRIVGQPWQHAPFHW